MTVVAARTQTSLIETQLPVSKLSKESYKERKANHGQTLTGLGKWWGRKPLVLVRATILGLLLPSTDDEQKDREIFLRLMTMDEEGLSRRKNKAIPLMEAFERLTPAERSRHFGMLAFEGRPRLSRQDAEAVQRLAFSRLSYDEKLRYCARPEEIDGPAPDAWAEINAHLATNASSLPELVRELGERRWGRAPRVGDAFCGGGSIPFEAARLGCEAYGSDLNPVAALLTWAALNIVGGGDEVAEEVRAAQEEIFAAVDRQLTEWRIEHNEQGWRADAYLYCVEANCPECGVRVPLAPSWVIGRGTRTVAVLELDERRQRFEIRMRSGVSDRELAAADAAGTVASNALRCPACGQSTPIAMLRGDGRAEANGRYGLRAWENDDLVPREDDVFGERLYCIRWVETYVDEQGRERTRRHYRAPDQADLRREARVLDLLRERFADWQGKGCIPSRRIEPGDKTDEPTRTRGWTHWHHLFNPRQLLVIGLASEIAMQDGTSRARQVAGLLGIGRCTDWNSRMCRWDASPANEKVAQTFSNQALNTLFNYGVRGLLALDRTFMLDYPPGTTTPSTAAVGDARGVRIRAGIWLTDPPYADAINYHELSEYFLAWYEKPIQRLFPEWYTDSRRALAVTGSDDDFRRTMVECYRNLTAHMPDDGLQVVMFTHQDAGVWADLALILWAAGLRVTAAWTIATETDTALRAGNYVQGTVTLVLRKRAAEPEKAFLDEIYPQVDEVVRRQLDDMLALDDAEDPNFGDTDYQLAAYAAALRVLTRYEIGDFDVMRELTRPRQPGEKTRVEEVIDHGVQIAANHLVPKGFNAFVWKTLTPAERFYLKGLDLESHAEYRAAAYQELARGLGIREYRDFLASDRANRHRLKSPAEWGNRMLGGEGFAGSLVRHALFAVHEMVREESAAAGRNWLRNEVANYWNHRQALVHVLRYLADRGRGLEAWSREAEAAGVLAGALANDGV